MKLKNSPPWFGNLVDIGRQIRGLEIVASVCSNCDILDLGSAEGDVSNWLIDNGGAASADCIDYAPERVRRGSLIDCSYNTKFFLHNLNEPLPELRRDSYQIVLALAILQKLNNPLVFLNTILPLCHNILAIRTPYSYIANTEIIPYLKERGFYCIQETDGYPEDPQVTNPEGEAWLGVFQNVR